MPLISMQCRSVEGIDPPTPLNCFCVAKITIRILRILKLGATSRAPHNPVLRTGSSAISLR